jgi:carbamoyl-phosphate synthase large subunit
MTDKPQKILILGSSALKIGEAGEFDYSGSQAIKALKEEGIYTVLINPNIATIQTSEYLADKVYLLPVNVEFVEKVIQKEKPDSILLSFGGQTALNCGMELHEKGILEKYNVRILGSPIEAVIDTEDREKFNKNLESIGVKVARSKAVISVDEALKVSKELGYPVLIRIAFALGGLGSGVCRNKSEVEKLASRAFSYTSQILVEEYLEGWREIEYEIVRDKFDNCITVCNMENFDPMGIHTGESIVVAPSQTLTNHEYHKLREIAIEVIRHFGIVGECNIQYALDKNSSDYRVIEVNARLSRSSALASKATGYPLAFVAAKLAIGYGLHELKNNVTKTTPAFFEPALDYCVVKIPRWDLKKFKNVSKRIGSSMKSVGEVMSIGRKFEEALQKAVRMLDIGANGIVCNDKKFQFDDIESLLKEPGEERLFVIAQAFENGYSVDQVNEYTNINKWFLYKVKNIVDHKRMLEIDQSVTKDSLLRAKKLGFSDLQIAEAINKSPEDIRQIRIYENIHPSALQIDTLAAEYPAKTNYLYLTYNAGHDDIEKTEEHNPIIILGSGPYRIGSSVEFDWCCVNAGRFLRKYDEKSVMINCNPETVSTDYDEFDFLFFEELTLETIEEIYRKLNARGLIISMGGQVPNNLAIPLSKRGLTILGTTPQKIDLAENRSTFSSLLDKIGVEQPEWSELSTIDDALNFANTIGYPVLVRPSYVLSGAAMGVASNDEELKKFLQKAVDLSKDHPTVISKFLENAKELEFDGVAANGVIVNYAISEHVENAGVHSGDATLVLPPQRTYLETMRQIKKAAEKIADALMINGPFNIQFIAKQNNVKVIECNLRASRSFPFVSKTLKDNFIETAIKVMLGKPYEVRETSLFEYDYVAVKAPEFSFTRLEGADPTTGVEMASTGEVACFGNDFNEAFLKALISVGYKFPVKSVLISSGSIESKAELLETSRILANLGIKFYATPGTAEFMTNNKVDVEKVYWPSQKKKPNVIDLIKSKEIDLVINIPKSYHEEELTNDYTVRRAAVDFKIPLLTNRQLVMRLAEALEKFTPEYLQIKSWDEYN